MGSDSSPLRFDQLVKRHRHLPHWQLGGAVYFITFRSARGELPSQARRQVIENMLFDHGRRYDLHFGVVMHDHAHAALQPLEISPGVYHDLSRILNSLKGVSARRVNQLLGTSGKVWQEESFDRIIRNDFEYDEKMQYMWDNPVRAGLVERSEDYEFFVWPPDAPR